MSARSDALTAQLRTSLTKAERRRAVRQFTAPEAAPVEARDIANSELRRFLTQGSRVEERAASEGTTTAGGFMVRPLFGEVIRYLKSFDEILKDVEVFETLTGSTLVRPQVSSLVAAPSASVSENTDVADSSGTLPVFAGTQSWGQCPTWPVTLYMSNMLLNDALAEGYARTVSDPGIGLGGPTTEWGQNITGSPAPALNPSGPDLLALMGSAAAEALHRKIAAVLQAALIASATGGQTQALGSLTVPNVALMLSKLGAAFRPGARLYMSSSDFGTLAKADSTGLRNLDALIPGGIVVTDAVSNWATGTTSGPILADMGSYFTWRQAPGYATVSRELRAEYAQTVVIMALRADFAATGRSAAAVFAN